MSFREVTSLRNQGKLDLALAMARADYARSIDNYSSSALFWTLRLICERSLNAGNSEEAMNVYNEMRGIYPHMVDNESIGKRCLKTLEDKLSPAFSQISKALSDAKSGNTEEAYNYVANLDCASFSELVKDNVSWIFYYHLKSIVDQAEGSTFNEVINNYLEKGLPRPSMAHSNILRLVVRFAGLHPDFALTKFISDCGVDSFAEDDFISDPSIAGGLSLVDRAVRRCFINKSISLKLVTDLFSGVVDESHIAELLSSSYSAILYKDSVELKDKKKFQSDADEYVSRIDSVSVRNKYHSKILESVMWEQDKGHNIWFKTFFEKWGLDAGLMEEDWVETTKDRVRYPSLAEKAILRYGDALSQENLMTDGYKRLLSIGVEKLPESESIPRRMARVLFNEGKTDEAIDFTKNLIKSRVSKYYFWFDLAEFVSKQDGKELCAACCAKAILTANDEKYIGKVHLVFGHILAQKKMYPEALREIEIYRNTCENNGWPIRDGYQKVKILIPQDTNEAENNTALYRQYELAADAFVYSDVESHNMVMVECKFEEKQDGKKRLMYYLYDSNNDSIKINPNAFGLDRKAKPMSCFEVKYLESEGKRRPILVRPIDYTPVLSYKRIVVDNVNKDKGVFHGIGVGFDITIPKDQVRFNVVVGDSLDIAYQVRVKEGRRRYKIIHVKKSERPCSLIKGFTGTLVLKENERGPFGLVNDVFIPQRFLGDLIDGSHVSGSGVMSNGKFIVLRLKSAEDES